MVEAAASVISKIASLSVRDCIETIAATLKYEHHSVSGAAIIPALVGVKADIKIIREVSGIPVPGSGISVWFMGQRAPGSGARSLGDPDFRGTGADEPGRGQPAPLRSRAGDAAPDLTRGKAAGARPFELSVAPMDWSLTSPVPPG
jgi:hypothetical protein